MKLAAVLLLFGVSRPGCRNGGAISCDDRNRGPQRFYRIANEVPTLLMLLIVIMVIVRPF